MTSSPAGAGVGVAILMHFWWSKKCHLFLVACKECASSPHFNTDIYRFHACQDILIRKIVFSDTCLFFSRLQNTFSFSTFFLEIGEIAFLQLATDIIHCIYVSSSTNVDAVFLFNSFYTFPYIVNQVFTPFWPWEYFENSNSFKSLKNITVMHWKLFQSQLFNNCYFIILF